MLLRRAFGNKPSSGSDDDQTGIDLLQEGVGDCFVSVRRTPWFPIRLPWV